MNTESILSYSKIDTGNDLIQSCSAIDFAILFHYSLWLEHRTKEMEGGNMVEP